MLSIGFNFLLISGISHAFTPLNNKHAPLRRLAPLQAEGGPPKYEKYDGVLREAEKVAEGSFMLHLELNPDLDVELDYEPGHVLGFEMEDTSDDLDEDTKTNGDTKNNGGWMRGPYTVSRCPTEKSVDLMIKVVGKKSKAFSEAPPGTPIRLGGKFHVPILEGISKEEAKKVVLISTGVGVGPCIGAIELALQDESFPPIALFASYRETADVVCPELLDTLASEHSDKFEWRPIISSEVGRLSSSKKNLDMVTSRMQGLGIKDSHYHLIGNAQLVYEWKQGLEKAGVPAERVTIEQYFNHKAEADKVVVENIASAISDAVAVEA